VGVLKLGTANALNINTIEVGNAKNSSGTLAFRTGLSGATVQIRAKNGTGRANLDVGYMTVPTVPREPDGNVDLTGGSVDALLGSLRIGQGQRIGVNQPNGTIPKGAFSFSAGTVDATTVTVGVGGTGNLTVGGGILRAGTISSGGNAGGSGAVNGTSTIALTSGTIQATTIQPGTGTANARNFNWSSGTVQNSPGTNLTIDSAIPLTLLTASTHTFTVDAAQTATVSSVIGGASGTGGIIKTGDGKLVLSGANTYAGATAVNQGTMLVNGSLSSGGGAVSVGNGGILGGSGSANRSITITSGGTIAPGTSAGTLTTGDVNLQSGGALQSELGTAYDQLNVVGTVTLAGELRTQFLWGSGFTIHSGPYTIIANDGVDPVVGTFSNPVVGGRIQLPTGDALITYTGGDGNDVVLSDVVPEPAGAAIAMVVGAVWASARRRGRGRKSN
jgi:autotransporter-associated beta strand protein